MFTSSGQSISLGRQIGAGGAGAVYEISGQPELVAKRFHSALSAEHVAKLRALVALSDERLNQLTAWPIALLYDKPDGAVVGFLMNRVAQASELHSLHSPKSRLQKFPEATWEFLLYVAANVARAVATVHAHGLIIGDINPKNILVTRQATVHLLDCDSFQVRTADGQTLRCEQGFPEYTPPELQGVTFRDIDRTAEQDAFGLAVVIFQLLFLGRHPFSGRYLGEGEMPIERAIREQRFAYGENVASYEMQAPLGTLPLSALPAELSALFKRAFLSSERPAPVEWIEPLERLAAGLNACELHNGHRYPAGLPACPWCGLESATGVQLFQLSLQQVARAENLLNVTDIWQEIANVAPPRADALVQYDATSLKVTEGLSQANAFPFAREAREYTQAQRQTYLMVLFFAGLFGIFSGLFIPAIIFAILLPAVIKFARYFVNLQVEPTAVVQTLLQPPPLSEDESPYIQTLFASTSASTYSEPIETLPLTLRIETYQQKSEEKLRKLEQRWQAEASTAAFEKARKALHEKCELYQDWSRERARRISAFESEERGTQLNRYLERHKLRSTTIEGVGDVTKKMLERAKIETAADLTPEKLKEVPQVGESYASRLLQWRREMEMPFTFDARRIRQEARLELESELERDLHQLETQLTNGSFMLQRIKNQVERQRLELQPQIAELQHSLAEVENAQARFKNAMSLRLLLIVLAGSFIFGFFLKPHPIKTQGRPLNTIIPQSGDGARMSKSAEDAARSVELYSDGKQFIRNGEYEKAVPLLEQAIQLAPNLGAAYDNLGFAYYKLKRFDDALRVVNQSLPFNNSYEAHRTLGLIYAARQDWTASKDHFNQALRAKESSNNVWPYDQVQFFYEVGEPLVETGLLQYEINILESDLKRDPAASLVQFQLGCYYLWTGNTKGVASVEKILKQQDEELLKELQRLKAQHAKRPSKLIKN